MGSRSGGGGGRIEATNGARFGDLSSKEFLNFPLFKVMDLGSMSGRFLDARLEDQEVSLAEVRILTVCAAHPGCTAVEVSRIIPVDTPTISRAVHSLAQRGLLSRRRSRTDRRVVRLQTTHAGLALLDECWLLLKQSSTEFLRLLSEVQRRSLRSAIEALLEVDA